MKFTPASVEGEHVVLTGPITGTVTLDDGTVVDVSAPVIGVDTPEQADEVAHLIGLRYADEGHPDVPQGFTYNAPKGAKAPKTAKTAKKKG